MSLTSLLPLAGAALAPVLGKVVDGVTEGLSFLDVLQQPQQADDAEAALNAEPGALQHDLVELAERLRERFAQLGIDLATPLRLKQDGRDHIVVDGDHPDRVLIESIFNNDQELTSQFNSVAASATRGQDETDWGVTQEFRFVVSQTDALIEFA